MKNIFIIIFASVFFILMSNNIYADKCKTEKSGKSVQNKIKETAAGCPIPAGFKYLDINNVRCRINTGGDMWWNYDVAQYFVPANSLTTPVFSASLWIGGLDVNNQLKLAAQRYRQGPNASSPGGFTDYWPGPLTIDGTASISEETCAKYDKFFVITRQEVDDFLAWWDDKASYPDYQIPLSIKEWPAHGDTDEHQSYYLAPFKDVDDNGDYDPTQGDYPYYDIENILCPANYKDDPNFIPTPTKEDEEGIVTGGILSDQVLKGDKTLWWVFNDKGNAHTETEGDAIGLEIRSQAFGFSTNDEINNMTFYSYEIINRSTYRLTQTYFSQWVDTDLGWADDDYVGCDVKRGLGYCYNGNDIDGSGQPWAYGVQPPAVGIDFFQGPYMDADDEDNPEFTGDCSIVSSAINACAINGVNFGNGIVDDERFGMRRFVYHNNNSPNPNITDPDVAPDYYNYLRGIWKDNTRMLYGGNAHYSTDPAGPECDFMFPGDSDPCNWGTSGIPPNDGYNVDGKFWTERTVGNQPFDRRFMQSAGPFTLEPGALNYITVGIPWARAASGGAWASVELLRTVDDKCQALFDVCFKVIDGPSAPDLSFLELDKEIIVYLSNAKGSNNYREGYAEWDITISELNPDSIAKADRYDSTFNFEGYQIYQLRDADVTIESIHDPDLVRLVAQYDIKNGIGRVINFYLDKNLGANVPVLEVEGGDNGIAHSFKITEDLFADEDKRLVNHKQYYYAAIAYAYNNYKIYNQFNPEDLNGQTEPYLAGRKNIKTYTAIPHIPVNGVIFNSDYGEGPELTRIQGHGNGGMQVEMKQSSIDLLMAKEPYGYIVNKIESGKNDTVYFGDSTNFPIIENPVYETSHGPVDIKVVDPLNVQKANYSLKFYDCLTPHDVDSTDRDSTNIVRAKWKLINTDNNNVYDSDTTIAVNYEQLLLDIGLSVNIHQQLFPGDTLDNGEHTDRNGFIMSSISYKDSSRRWLGGVEDVNIPGDPENWIRAGMYKNVANPALNDWHMAIDLPEDPLQMYGKIVRGTWAPYILSAFYETQGDAAPAYNTRSKTENRMSELASVNIVITPDKTLWTRCPVIEMCADEALSEGNVERFTIRDSKSVDKDGNPAEEGSGSSSNPIDPNYINERGMGWFPGYAINIETGERLNMMFGENSWLVAENGRDMLWNPTPNITSYPDEDEVLFGGMHYVYIFGTSHRRFGAGSDMFKYDYPAYDAGSMLRYSIDSAFNCDLVHIFSPYLYSGAMYVGIPLSIDNNPYDTISIENWLDNEVTIKIRVDRPYQRYFSKPIEAEAGTNDRFPEYTFSTDGISATYTNIEKAKSDLDLINVVPNPYYGYSSYEINQIDNRIKIVNLPKTCTVTIYSLNGTLIRQFTKDEPATYIDWDLKNFAGIPISGGLYIIHVKAQAGERIVKWFGSMRPVDLNAF